MAHKPFRLLKQWSRNRPQSGGKLLENFGIEQKRVFCFICPEIYISSTKKWGVQKHTFAPPPSSTAPVK